MTEPEIRYCRTSDGVGIAYTVVGEGPPLLYMRRFMAPGLDDELNSGFCNWEPFSLVRSVVLMDLRGTGMSEPFPDATFDQWLTDMEAVTGAVNADRIDLAGEVRPCAFTMAYALRHPDKVANLVLWNPLGRGGSPRARMPRWQRELAVEDWKSFTDLFALQVFGWKRADAAERMAERMRRHFTHEQYERMNDVIESIEVAMEDASGIQARTLIISDENFLGEAADSWSIERLAFPRRLAAQIPSAQLTIIKKGDLTGAGSASTRFLEPNIPSPQARASDAAGTAIVLFADIADSTALTERLGDAAFRAKARELDASLRERVRANGGSVIDAKTLGDGILATFPAASQAIAAALSFEAAAADVGLGLHVGLHAGDVIREHDNVFGGAVNIAARISGLAQPGEVLVSATVRDLGRTSAGVTFEDRGEHALKGVAEPQRVFAVRAKDGG